MFGGGETLEESLLTANVPGRYSKWDKNDPGSRDVPRYESGDESEHEEEPDGYRSEEEDPAMKAINDKREKEEEDVPEAIREAIRRGERPGARTGVKGVLADYKAFKQAAYDQKQKEKGMRAAILKRMAEGATEKAPGPSDEEVLAAMMAQQMHAGCQEDHDDDEDADDFMEDYRRKRLQELKASASLPVYGEIKEVTAYEFVDALNKTDSRVKVIVHIYESYIKPCATLNKYLEAMARKYTNTRFLRIQAGATQKSIDEVALPMLVVYQGGHVVETFARVHEEFGDTFLQADVEWLLESRRLLQGSESEGGESSIRPVLSGISRIRMGCCDDETDY